MFNWKNKNAQPPQEGRTRRPPTPVPAKSAPPKAVAPNTGSPNSGKPGSAPPNSGRPNPLPPNRVPPERPSNNNARPGPSPEKQLNPNANRRPEQQQKPRSVSGVALYFDDTLIRCVKPDGKVEILYWRDLAGVFIMVSDQEPYASDLHWILAGKEHGGCVFPNTAAGAAEIIRYMQDTLKGFNNSEIIKAMERKENKKFLIWKEQD